MYDILKKFWQEVKDIIEKYQLRYNEVEQLLLEIIKNHFNFKDRKNGRKTLKFKVMKLPNGIKSGFNYYS